MSENETPTTTSDDIECHRTKVRFAGAPADEDRDDVPGNRIP